MQEARKKMNPSAKLRTDFKIAVDHIRDRVVSNVSDGKKQGQYNVDDAELKKILRMIEMSFEQGFSTAAAQVEKSINEVTR